MKKTKAVALLGTVVFALLCPWVGQAANPTRQVQQVVVLLWHGLTWEDVERLDLPGPLALGVLNSRPGGGDILSGGYLSIGAGARAVGWNGAADFLPREAAEHLYRLRTGVEPGVFVQPDIALIQGAQTVSYRVELGALGTAVLEAGETIKVLGSSTADSSFHWAALVGMDRYGRIFQGDLDSEVIVGDPRYPYGIRTDYERLKQEVLAASERLVIVDLGDPFRFDRYQAFFLPEQREVARTIMVGDACRFVEELAAQRPEGTVILLISPHPGSAGAAAGLWLTPALFLGLEEGLLTSPTTRWPGILTNMDLAPTILALLQIEHNQPFIGRAGWIEPRAGARDDLEEMVNKIAVLSRWRSTVLRLVVLGQIAVYALVLASLISTWPLPHWAWRGLQTALLSLLAVPLALLPWDVSPYLSLAVVLAAASVSLVWRRPLLWAGVIAALTSSLLSVDILRGSWLMRYSPLGYDPVGGARFYGIGNEYMGVMVGAGIMTAALFGGTKTRGLLERLVVLAFFGGLLVLIGFPALGTNAGGAISAVFGFGAAWLAFTGRRANWRWVFALALCAAMVLGLFTTLDGHQPAGVQSHFGQTAELFRRDGWPAVTQIARRKVEMNLRLLRSSIWSRALIATLIVMAASFIWPSRFMVWLRKNHPRAMRGIGGVVVGAVAAFVFNDSGVVAAATCISFGSSPLLLLALELKHNLIAPQAHVQDDGDGH